MNTPIKNNTPLSKTQNGSVIVWILIAVGLMAALSYAFMGSSRNSTSMISNTQADAYASEIIAYGNEVKSAVKRLQLRGCSDTEISFENNVESILYDNPNSPTDNSCHVFDIAGGGLNWKKFSKNITGPNEVIFAGNTCIEGVGSQATCIGSNGIDDEELTLHTRIKDKQTCLILNKKLNVNNTGENPPQDGGTGHTDNKFTGTFPDGSAINANADLADKKGACYEGGLNPPVGTYTYYHILIAR